MTEENQLPATHQDSSEFAVVLSVTAQLLSDSGLIFFFPPFGKCQRYCRPSCAAKLRSQSALHLSLSCWEATGAAQPFSCSTRWSCSCLCCYSKLSQKIQNEAGVSLASSFTVCEAVNSVVKTGHRRNTHVAVGRTNGCV